MISKSERITTLGALLNAMWTKDYWSRKTYAEVVYLPSNICRAREYFDDGKGHSGAFSCQISEVDTAVFEDAREKKYVTGRPEIGYISKTDFVLTDDRDLKEQIWAIVEAWREEVRWKRRSSYDVAHGRPGTYIKIVQVPDGEAPEEVRRAWVGMVLPCLPLVGYGAHREKGAVSLQENAYNRYGYAVPQKEALEKLAEKHPEAARWWKSQGFPKEADGQDYFSFSEMEVKEFVGTFVHQKIVVHDFS